jgi:hypothetical protein
MTNFSFVPHEFFNPEDFNSLPLEEDMEAILISDAKCLKQLQPILETLSWRERIAVGLTAYWTIDRDNQLIKLVPQRELSEQIKQAIEIVENLSPEALAGLATDILSEDFEIRDLDDERN